MEKKAKLVSFGHGATMERGNLRSGRDSIHGEREREREREREIVLKSDD